MQSVFYSLVSTFTYKSGTKYRFVLLGNLTVRFPGYDFGQASYLDQNNKIRLITNRDSITIFSGYAWDGNSPAIRIGNRFYGTPTPDSTVLSSLTHDCLCQFRKTLCFKLSKKQIDEIFLGIMLQNRFKLAGIYYRAVRMFGELYSFLGSFRDNKVSCSQ
jgi:hypothetical protein